MMASVLNLNYWISFYLSMDKTIAQFDGRMFDKKLYSKRKFVLNIITGIFILFMVGYIVFLAVA